jgi:hypothetical protein
VKNLLPWLKSNWAILVLGLIAVAALPVLWFVSNGMNTKVVETFQKRVETDYKDVSNANNPYKIVSPTGESLLETSKPINHAMTEAYRTASEGMQAQTSVVSKAAMDLNTDEGKHKPLIDGLFPQPTELEKLAKPKAFARKLIEEARPALLKSIHAGMPPEPTDIAAQLNDMVAAKREQVRQEQGRTELDSEEQQGLQKDLLTLRLSRYQGRAAEIQVYADGKIFDDVPADAVDKTASLAQVWDWQERLWIDTDVLRAVATANGDSGGRGVPGSVVKRITKLSVDPPPYTTNSTEGVVEVRPYEAGTDKAPTDFSRSITGRYAGPGSNNKWYDLRHVTIEMVADARRLPAFVDALASTNFMSVVDVDLTKLEPGTDLREGFYYGADPVVKATIVIETVWFREWREQWMPVDVKRALGMDQNAPAAEAAAAPARAQRPVRGGPPPRPGGPPPADEGPGGGRRGRRGAEDGGG